MCWKETVIDCRLQELYEADLIRILTEPEDAITKEYELLLKEEGEIQLIYEKDALLEIARKAIEQKTGARGLRNIIQKYIRPVL